MESFQSSWEPSGDVQLICVLEAARRPLCEDTHPIASGFSSIFPLIIFISCSFYNLNVSKICSEITSRLKVSIRVEEISERGWSILGKQFPAAESPNSLNNGHLSRSLQCLNPDLKHLGLGIGIVLKVISSASWRLFRRTSQPTWFTWGQLYPWHLNFLNMQIGLSLSRSWPLTFTVFLEVPQSKLKYHLL